MPEEPANRNKIPNVDEMLARANEIYENLKISVDLETVHTGKYIAIDATSGSYFIGETRDEAIQKGRKELPKVTFVIRRIGGVDRVSRHSPLPTLPKSFRARLL